MSNRNIAIIVAGGSGKRMQSSIPKQFLLLNGLPVLMHTLNRFYEFDPSIELILVLPEDQISYWQQLCKQYRFEVSHKIVTGGETRFHSVRKGIRAITGNGVVAIHDGVRPLIDKKTLQNCFVMAAEKGNAIPVVSVVESVREINGTANRAVNRENLALVQTPQCFQAEILNKAFTQDYCPDFTDDASVVEKTGLGINLCEGNRINIKITTPEDLQIAELLLKNHF